jgi:DNA polymerase-1
MSWLNHFNEIWAIDFEFSQPPGERPRVTCLVAREFHSKRIIVADMDQLRKMPRAPFGVGFDSLVVAFYSSADWNCFLSLGWELPVRVLDLWVEFRAAWNGNNPIAGFGLLGCLVQHNLDSMAVTEKTEMRELAIRGAPYTPDEMRALLDYCGQDVDALVRLLSVMAPTIDLPRALLRGRYMCAVARMEHAGVPIDVETLSRLRESWGSMKDCLIESVDADFQVYDGKTFKQNKFAQYLNRTGIPWPVSDSGHLILDDDTFRQQTRFYPILGPLRDLRHLLSELKLEKLEVGSDGRNRSMLRPFASKSGRNQPSNNKFIFGLPVWVRGLIKPTEGRSIAYVDWKQQELGIAAALSGDSALIHAYHSGDPYLEFAKMAGAVPSTATKKTHPTEREAFKTCMLAVQYGMTAQGLAAKLDKPTAFARNLIQQHREKFPKFWKWYQQQVDTAMLLGKIQTVFGWPIHTIGGDNPRSLANFGCQANGAEILRLACSMITEQGIVVCAPIHDALLIEGPSGSIREIVEATQASMREASAIVLAGFELESSARVFDFPARFSDERGTRMWEQVMRILTQQSQFGFLLTGN